MEDDGSEEGHAGARVCCAATAGKECPDVGLYKCRGYMFLLKKLNTIEAGLDGSIEEKRKDNATLPEHEQVLMTDKNRKGGKDYSCSNSYHLECNKQPQELYMSNSYAAGKCVFRDAACLFVPAQES